MKAQKGSRGILSLALVLEVGGFSTSPPGLFTHGKETRDPLYRKMGEAQCRHAPVEKKFAFAGIRSLDRAARS
jgi:hypothetical protein